MRAGFSWSPQTNTEIEPLLVFTVHSWETPKARSSVLVFPGKLTVQSQRMRNREDILQGSLQIYVTLPPKGMKSMSIEVESLESPMTQFYTFIQTHTEFSLLLQESFSCKEQLQASFVVGPPPFFNTLTIKLQKEPRHGMELQKWPYVLQWNDDTVALNTLSSCGCGGSELPLGRGTKNVTVREGEKGNLRGEIVGPIGESVGIGWAWNKVTKAAPASGERGA